MQLEDLCFKKILLLQGPVGPFFRNLALDLQKHKASVIKLNFNGGDEFFYPSGFSFTGHLQDLPTYLKDLVIKHQIDTIMLFGDCRPIHKVAKDTLTGFPIDWYVFEEGYLRPNHITCEQDGVNGYSNFPKRMKNLLKQQQDWNFVGEKVVEVGSTFKYSAWWAMIYYIAAHFYRRKYRQYEHHRPLSIAEAWPWVKSAVRKLKYKIKERNIQDYLRVEKKQQYYLVPLQTYNDAQIIQHSPYECVEDFITEVLLSFSQHAAKDKLLVIKQHPFDRGYRDYTQHIQYYSKKFGVESRVFYIHDQYLPDLINCACGVIVVNSTVGMTAVESYRPVKVCGRAIYDLDGLTVQCRLDDFWSLALTWQVDVQLIQNYVGFLRHHTQFNGSFYKKLSGIENASGIVWDKQLDVQLNLQHEYDHIKVSTQSKV